MAADIFERKAYFVVGWKGDVVSDNIFQNLRGKSESDKGKKVKLKLSRQGLQIRKSAMFQASLLDSYRIENIYFMTVNQETKSCLLCILKDPKHKYAILAFRCHSDLDAGLFVQHFKDLKRKVGGGGYEMKRVGDGNWTLRGLRSAATRQHLQISGKTPNGTGNGAIRHAGDHHAEMNHVTVIQNPGTITSEDMFRNVRKRENIGVQTMSHHVDIDQMSEASDVSSFKDELESLSQELRDIKLLLERSTGISFEEHIRRAKEAEVAKANGHVSQHPHPAGMARVYVSNRPPPLLTPGSQPVFAHRDAASLHTSGGRAYGEQAVTTPTIKTAEVANALTREFSSGEEQAPRVMAVPHPHGSKPVMAVRPDVVDGTTNGVSEGTMSGRNSLRVKFDPKMRLPNDARSRSMRIKSDFMVPSTVERSIENTYARPTILSHGNAHDNVGRQVRRTRPQSVYLISGVKPVRIHHSRATFEGQF